MFKNTEEIKHRKSNDEARSSMIIGNISEEDINHWINPKKIDEAVRQNIIIFRKFREKKAA